MFDELNPYRKNGHFFFAPDQSLGEVCNAPKDGSGVYVINALSRGRIEIVYIGSSGKLATDGSLKQRKGGLYDRIVNGKQFDAPRRNSWPTVMQRDKIDALDIYWYGTFNKSIQHIPGYVEGLLLQKYYEIYGSLPRWNQEY